MWPFLIKVLMTSPSRFSSFIDCSSGNKNCHPDGVVSTGKHKNKRQPKTNKTSEIKIYKPKKLFTQHEKSNWNERIPDPHSPRQLLDVFRLAVKANIRQFDLLSASSPASSAL